MENDKGGWWDVVISIFLRTCVAAARIELILDQEPEEERSPSLEASFTKIDFGYGSDESLCLQIDL